MHLTSLEINNIRSFEKANINLSKSINIFVGQNNHGKSTILSTIGFLQGNFLTLSDIRMRNAHGHVVLGFDGLDLTIFKSNIALNTHTFDEVNGILAKKIFIDLLQDGNVIKQFRSNDQNNPNSQNFFDFPSTEPQNIIYPFLSKRKVVNYSESVNLQSSMSVRGDFQDLFAKIDRLCNEDFQPAATEYRNACLKILGYRISTVNSTNGKKAAMTIKNIEHIPIASMGEGIVNILGLIVDLCIAENKIFLIEELENDIHPKALKGLLDLILEKSKNNQFFISTHSNIVVKYLGSDFATKTFQVSMKFSDSDFKIPISEVKEVADNEEERRLLLEELGYEFNDFGLWNSWLFLEESSAEAVIREFLIPQFCKRLSGKLRTFSANGLLEVEPKFRDFNNLFVFLHLTETYKNRVWVLVDSGDKEKEIIDKMKIFYVEKNGWSDSNFRQLAKHDFEEYYPREFREKFEQNKNLAKDKKSEFKKQLLNELKDWIAKNPDQAKSEFQESASEVIELLKEIGKSVC